MKLKRVNDKSHLVFLAFFDQLKIMNKFECDTFRFECVP